ncbi:MAG: hypothetical protein HUJ68_04515, partial [Clostridia bacterium]|nr:hypothetical protein [Clostridia bacterium]
MAYARQSTLSTALNSIGNIINAGGNIASFADSVLRDKANSDLLYQKAVLEGEIQDFTNKIQRSNNYTNWQTDADNFLEQKKSQLNKEAPNSYTANLYNQMLSNARIQLHNNVSKIVLQKEFNDLNSTDLATVQLNEKNFAGQDAINENFIVFSNMYSSGRGVDSNYIRASTIQSANNSIRSDLYNFQNSILENAFNSGLSYDSVAAEVENYAMNQNYTVRMLDAEYANPEKVDEAMTTGKGILNISQEVDKTLLLNEINKSGKARWDAMIKERQTKN